MGSEVEVEASDSEVAMESPRHGRSDDQRVKVKMMQGKDTYEQFAWYEPLLMMYLKLSVGGKVRSNCVVG